MSGILEVGGRKAGALANTSVCFVFSLHVSSPLFHTRRLLLCALSCINRFHPKAP